MGPHRSSCPVTGGVLLDEYSMNFQPRTLNISDVSVRKPSHPRAFAQVCQAVTIDLHVLLVFFNQATEYGAAVGFIGQLSPVAEVALIASRIQGSRNMRGQTEKPADLSKGRLGGLNQILVLDHQQPTEVRAILLKQTVAVQPMFHE